MFTYALVTLQAETPAHGQLMASSWPVKMASENGKNNSWPRGVCECFDEAAGQAPNQP